MSNTNRWLVLLLLLAVASAPVRGAEQAADAAKDDDKKPPRQVEDVEYVEVNVPYAPKSNTIATKLPMDVQVIPANVGTVTSTLFHEQGSLVLGDALRNVSGLNVQAGTGVHDYFLIRGFNNLDGGLVLTDGALEPEVSYYDLYNVEGVEVFKGPAGFLYGGGPMAGAVNLVRKQPLPGDLLVVGASYGSFATWDASVDWNAANAAGNRNFRLNSVYRQSDLFRDVPTTDSVAVNPSFSMRFGEDTTLNLNLEYVEENSSPDVGLPLFMNQIPDVPRERSYQSPLDFSEQQISRFQVDYETKVSDKVKLRNKTYYRRLDWQTAGTLLLTTVPLPIEFGGPQVVRTLTALDDNQEYLGNQFEVVFSLNSGKVQHELLAGLELTNYTDDFGFGVAPPCDATGNPPGCMPSIGLFTPLDSAAPANVMPNDFLVGNGENTIVAPYVSDHITFSRKFQMLVGARYDDIDTKVDFDVNFQDFISGFQNDSGELSPFGGLVFTPADDATVYLNAGRSFAPIGFRVQGAAGLDSEQSTQYELGARKRFAGGRLQATLALYHIERENIAILDASGVTEQAGDQKSRGVEFDFVSELGQKLRLFFSYAFNDSELTRFNEFDPLTGAINDRSGNDPAFTPRNLLSLWVSKSYDSGFGIGGGVRFFDDQFIAADNVFAIDSALILDAALFYDIDAWRFKLNLKNLSDEEYEQRGFGAGSVLPANPFAIYAGVEFRR